MFTIAPPPPFELSGSALGQLQNLLTFCLLTMYEYIYHETSSDIMADAYAKKLFSLYYSLLQLIYDNAVHGVIHAKVSTKPMTLNFFHNTEVQHNLDCAVPCSYRVEIIKPQVAHVCGTLYGISIFGSCVQVDCCSSHTNPSPTYNTCIVYT